MSSAATLSIFNHLLASVAEEMGVTLERSAYSPNFKERLDFSCAVFLGTADEPLMPAQAAISISGDQIEVYIAGTSEAVPGNVNAVPAIVESTVAYCIRCVAIALLDLDLPMNAGMLKSITVIIPESGNPGSPEHNSLIRNCKEMALPGKITQYLEKEDILQISTPGGGGWGNLSS